MRIVRRAFGEKGRAQETERSLAAVKDIPFSIDRNDGRTLLAQVLDGLREAIVGGYYRSGDVLPSYRELAPLLGVSEIVTRTALRRLAEEGLATQRPRLGTVVRDRAVKQWRGHVVLVGPEGDDNYLQAILAGTLRDRLMDEGYLFTEVCVRRTADGTFDFSHLDAVLSRSVDFVLSIYARPEIIRRLSRINRPHAVFGEVSETPPNAVGFTRLDYSMAVGDFAGECARLGVRDVVEVNWFPTMCDLSPLESRGIRVKRMKLAVDATGDRLGAVRRAGMAAFAKIAAENRLSREAVYFFGDDYLASGALAALSFAGLRAPEQFRFATWSNRGSEPAYPRELARMMMDPFGAGATIADAVLAYLKTNVYPSGGVVGPTWISGETMGETSDE